MRIARCAACRVALHADLHVSQSAGYLIQVFRQNGIDLEDLRVGFGYYKGFCWNSNKLLVTEHL